MGRDKRSDKVALLFEECVEFSDPAMRAAFLDAACQDHPDLREEVEALLRVYEVSGHFLNGGTPPMGLTPDAPGGVSPSDLEPGGYVGPYRLLGLMGEGSTSTVYLAEQQDPVHRWVALKIIKPGMDTRNVILRFSLERQALALMDHPGIAKLLDAGSTASGRSFFVMELVSGAGISSYCDENQLTIPQRLELFIQVCNAVLHAHQRGIIHRDLKPDNILVSGCDGRTVIKIVDFGIAKVLHSWGQENATRTGVMPFVGTPAYMSPEQVQMTSPDLDTRTDIYSLGVLLYELLTGHPPFEHKDLMGAGLEEMCRIIRVEEPLAPSERLARMPVSEQTALAAARGTTPASLRRTLANDLDWITLKALEKKRERRYATAAGMVEDITRHFEHLPVSAAAQSWRYRLAKSLRRNRKFVTAASAAGTLVLASAFFIVNMAIDARFSATQARTMEQAANAAERQSHQAMVAMHVSAGMSASDDRYYDKAVLWFANAARIAGRDDRQSEVNARRAIGWMSRVSVPIGAFMHPSPIRLLEFSQDSRFLLALGNDHGWHLWDASTQVLVPWATELGFVQAAAWSPEGSQLAVARADGEVGVYEAAKGTLLHAFRVSPPPTTVGFTPDSRYLIVGNSAYHVFELTRHSPQMEVPQYSEHIVGLSFSASSTRFVGVNDQDQARILDLGNGVETESGIRRLYPHRHAIRTDACTSKSNYQEDFLGTARLSLPVLAADGSRLLTRTGPYEITFWDLASGEPVNRVDTICCSCRFIASPEAGLVACGLDGGKVGLWDIATAKPYQLLPSQGACILDIAFGLGGRNLITAETNGLARLWSVEEGKQLQSPLHHSTDVDIVAFAQNGRMVATGQADGLVRVWNVSVPESNEPSADENSIPSVVSMDASGQYFVLAREPGHNPSSEACNRQITVWRTDTGGPVGATVPYDGCVGTAAFSPNSTLLAVGVGSPAGGAPGRIKFQDLNGRSLPGMQLDLPSGPASIAWNPVGEDLAVICHTGELLVVGSGPEMAVRWRSRVISPPSRINPTAAFTADGRTLVILGPDGSIQVRDASDGHLRYRPLTSEPDGFWSFTLSRDGRLLGTTTIEGEVVVWDLQTGVPASHGLQHPGWVYRCRFSADDDTLVTAAHDGKVRLWDWRAGIALTPPLVHPNEVFDAVFTPDNRWVLTACRDGNLRIWEPHSGEIAVPSIKVGQQAFNIEITRNGDHAVIGSMNNEVCIVSLAMLHERPAYDAEDLCLLGEVISSCVVQKGAIRDLTTSEWLERYERIRRLHPEAFLADQSYGLDIQTLEKTTNFSDSERNFRLPVGSVHESSRVASAGISCTSESCADCPSAIKPESPIAYVQPPLRNAVVEQEL